jgi:hypothetical protein
VYYLLKILMVENLVLLSLKINIVRRILVYSWIHGEEWLTFSSDTVEGFQLLRDLTFLDQPEVVTLLERPRDGSGGSCDEGGGGESVDVLIVVGTRQQFLQWCGAGAARSRIIWSEPET